MSEADEIATLKARVEKLETMIGMVFGELELNQDRLKEHLSYDPDTGRFTHIKPTGGVKLGSEAGTLTPGGYIQIKISNRPYMAHRLAFLYMEGSMPVGVDHIDGERSNNRWSNLRASDQVENMHNRAMQSNNTSGYTGVCWEKSSKKWRADIRVGRQCIRLGVFVNIEDAIEARKVAEVEYGFHRNHGKRISRYQLIDAERKTSAARKETT